MSSIIIIIIGPSSMTSIGYRSWFYDICVGIGPGSIDLCSWFFDLYWVYSFWFYDIELWNIALCSILGILGIELWNIALCSILGIAPGSI